MKSGFIAIAILFALCIFSATSHAQQVPEVSTLDYRLTAQPIADGVFVVQGTNADFAISNGCNIINTGFIVTGEGVVVINTGPSKLYGEQLRKLISRTTSEPVVRVIHLNLHPDYFLGNQAFSDVTRYATEVTHTGMQREAKSYEDNLYRLCGDWMKGTEALLPDQTLAPSGSIRIGKRELEWQSYEGHTDSDLVLIDKTSGVMFVGGLVFAQRVPTTPHARIEPWLKSLELLSRHTENTVMVPSHGPWRSGRAGVQQTEQYLRWLDARLRDASTRGLEMNELLRLSAPTEIRQLAAFDTEYIRNLAHLYPQYESRALKPTR